MKTIHLFFIAAFSLFPTPSRAAPFRITLSPDAAQNRALPFLSHRGPGRFDNSLAYNVTYAPIKILRTAVARAVGKDLKFFTGWNPKGEAHVTVITPPEFSDILSQRLTMDDIDEIARKLKIQTADLAFYGIGSARVPLEGQMEETYFVIVESEHLRRIRRAIDEAFVARGGDPKAWDPDTWYPHITLGFTKRDLHESDGVFKDRRRSLDERFRLSVE